MKRLLYIICAIALCCTSCNKNEEVTENVDLSGKYGVYFSIPVTPAYTVNKEIQIVRNNDGSYKVEGEEPMEDATFEVLQNKKYVCFSIPIRDLKHNNQDYYFSLSATLKYNGGKMSLTHCFYYMTVQNSHDDKSGQLSSFRLRRL